MKLLILVADYPHPHNRGALAFVHTRNVSYVKKGHIVNVLNFSCTENYVVDEIPVFSYSSFITNVDKLLYYDCIVCHAPNLRNHYRFLRKFSHNIINTIFFFHGHEVLKINEVYSKPYNYVRNSAAKIFFQNIYDDVKFLLWRRYFENNYKHLYFVFVSNWMKGQFLKWVHPTLECLDGRYSIRYNSVNQVFEDNSYDWDNLKEFDFITIRGYLDNSKYGVDIVNELAMNNPQLKFLLIGRGEFFSHYKKASNLLWIDRRMDQSEMIEWMNKAKCALMPTRTDAQGVMMCEMATFGLPVITSDIPVCHEVFDGFDNIAFISNNNNSIDLSPILNSITQNKYPKNKKYLNSILIDKELSFIEKCCQK